MFIVNADGALWTRRYTGSWGGWSTMGGQWTGTPSSAVDGAGSAYLVARGTNGHIFCNRLDRRELDRVPGPRGQHHLVAGRRVGHELRVGVRAGRRQLDVVPGASPPAGPASSPSAATSTPPTRSPRDPGTPSARRDPRSDPRSDPCRGHGRGARHPRPRRGPAGGRGRHDVAGLAAGQRDADAPADARRRRRRAVGTGRRPGRAGAPQRHDQARCASISSPASRRAPMAASPIRARAAKAYPQVLGPRSARARLGDVPEEVAHARRDDHGQGAQHAGVGARARSACCRWATSSSRRR